MNYKYFNNYNINNDVSNIVIKHFGVNEINTFEKRCFKGLMSSHFSALNDYLKMLFS